ncbi:hypothetical protein Tco_0662746 [Tanacetum coccineum]
MLYNDESFEPRGNENIVVSNVEEDDSFTFTIRIFLLSITYPEVSPLSCSTESEDLIFDPGIITFHNQVDSPNKFFEASRVRLICPVQLELLILSSKGRGSYEVEIMFATYLSEAGPDVVAFNWTEVWISQKSQKSSQKTVQATTGHGNQRVNKEA